MPTAVYDTIGRGYARQRRADPRIATRLISALGDAQSVLNVGAGAGSYEPLDRSVVAVEPSAVMLAQRSSNAALAVQGRAEALPFPDGAFDAVMGVLTLHHWTDRTGGLAECARVARQRVVLLTWDPEADAFWLVRDYLPQFAEVDRRYARGFRRLRFPARKRASLASLQIWHRARGTRGMDNCFRPTPSMWVAGSSSLAFQKRRLHDEAKNPRDA